MQLPLAKEGASLLAQDPSSGPGSRRAGAPWSQAAWPPAAGAHPGPRPSPQATACGASARPRGGGSRPSWPRGRRPSWDRGSPFWPPHAHVASASGTTTTTTTSGSGTAAWCSAACVRSAAEECAKTTNNKREEEQRRRVGFTVYPLLASVDHFWRLGRWSHFGFSRFLECGWQGWAHLQPSLLHLRIYANDDQRGAAR